MFNLVKSPWFVVKPGYMNQFERGKWDCSISDRWSVVMYITRFNHEKGGYEHVYIPSFLQDITWTVTIHCGDILWIILVYTWLRMQVWHVIRLVCFCCNYIYTLWLFNIAMEHGPFIDGLPIETSIYKGFSMAMLNNQRVYIYIYIHMSYRHL